MPDHAVSADPAVQAQLDRLTALSPGADILGLDRIGALLARLGSPQRALPPVFHVAGTNGKGSTCAFLRASVEAAGLTAHVYTSPHLVRFNERIRLAGRPIDDALLAALLAEVLDAGADIGASFFEVTTAAAFLAFARVAADVAIVEVGLGGRLDATNIVSAPAICGIAQLGLDHQGFLGDRIEQIAAEKAGIAKRGVPLVTLHYPARVAEPIGQAVRAAGAPWLAKGGAWDANAHGRRLHYRDAAGTLVLPLPRLPGRHQADNAALAVAMLRHQRIIEVPEAALRAGLGWAEWPARLQRLDAGPLPRLLPDDAELWLDGGHNPAAARVIADFIKTRLRGRPLILIVGLLANKDLPGFLEPLGRLRPRVIGIPVAGHAHHPPAAIAAAAAASGAVSTVAHGVHEALAMAGDEAQPVVLVCGSLYLAGTVLAANDQLPQ